MLVILPIANSVKAATTHSIPASSSLTTLDKPLQELNVKPQKEYTEGFFAYEQTMEHPLDEDLIIFDKEANFASSHFTQRVSFQLTQFRAQTNFASTTFHKSANFKWAIFYQEVDFSHATFIGEIDFYSAFFKNNANLYDVKFYANADFQATAFFKEANFASDSFLQNATFYNASFNGKTSFNDAIFYKDANFSYTTYASVIDFSKTKFEQTANFQHADFNGQAYFNDTKLPKYLDFSHINNIKNVIDLTSTLPPAADQQCLINLVGTDISKIKLRYDKFKLYFPIGTDKDEISYVYEGLLNSLNNNGYTDNYKDLYIEYQKYLYLKDNHWLMNAIVKYCWNYGFNKERVFYLTGGLLLFFSLINSFCLSWLLHHAYSIQFLIRKDQKSIKHHHLLITFIDDFPRSVVYTSFIFFGGLLGLRSGEYRFRSHNVFVNFYLILIMSSGVISTMLILNYIIGK